MLKRHVSFSQFKFRKLLIVKNYLRPAAALLPSGILGLETQQGIHGVNMQKQGLWKPAKSPSTLNPPQHPFYFLLFLPSFVPSVFNPAQFAHLDETILVISVCNGTLLTPITTIKTLLPLGLFQVLINQMAAKRPLGATPYASRALLHAPSPQPLTDHVPSLKSTSGGTKRLHAGRQMPRLCKWKDKPLSFTLSLPFHLCDVGIMNITSPLGTVPYWEGLESCPVCSSLIA